MLDIGEVQASGRLVGHADAAILGRAQLQRADCGWRARLPGAEGFGAFGLRYGENLGAVEAAETEVKHRCLERRSLVRLIGDGGAKRSHKIGIRDDSALAGGAGALGGCGGGVDGAADRRAGIGTDPLPHMSELLPEPETP